MSARGIVLGCVAGVLGAAGLVAGTASGQGVPPVYQIPGATPAAARLISNFEGFSATPYNDAQTNGNCTIGYGTLLHRGPCTAADSATYPNGITTQQALGLLQNEANADANAIDRNVTVPLTAEQRDALTSFVYNVGIGAFQGSTLLRDLNAGNAQAAADQLLRWRNQNGRPVPGLLNRRNAERCYFLHGAITCQGQIQDARVTRVGLAPKSRRPRAGSKAHFIGTGWAPGSIRLVVFVPNISPYRRVVLHARADRSGRFTVSWRVSRRVTDTLRWKLVVSQAGRSATGRVRIRGA